MAIKAILVDQREPAWVQALSFGGAMKAVTLLEHGDLLAVTDDETTIAIERKSPDDFLGSLKDERLWAQLAGMIQQTRWAYLVITDAITRGPDGKVVTDRGMTGWTWQAVWGALLKVQELGIMVVFAAGDADYEGCVSRIAARSHAPNLVVPPTKEPSILSDGEKVLLSLPGIGLDKVPALYEYTGSNTARALEYLTDVKTNGCPGIGAGIKRNIRKVLGLRDGEVFTVVDADQLIQEEVS